MSHLPLRCCVTALLLLAGANAEDTTWTRVYWTGQGAMPVRVRCYADTIYVAGSATIASTMQAFLLKYHGDGTQDWVAPVDYSYYSVATALALGADGKLAMGMDAGYGTPLGKIALYGADGDTLWTREFASATLAGVGISGNGDVFAFGTKGNPVQDSVWIARHTANGVRLWQRSYRLGAAHQVHGFGVDSLGLARALMRVSTAVGRPAGPTIMKFRADGDTEWVKTYTSIPNPVSMTVAPSGNAFVLDAGSVKKVGQDGAVAWSAAAPPGSLASDVGFDDDENVYVAYTDAQPDIRVRKYGAQGSALWTLGCVRPGQDQAMSVTADATGRPIVTGLTVEPNMRVLTVKFVSLPAIGEQRLVMDQGRPSATLSSSGVLECFVAGQGRYRIAVFDQSGRAVMPSVSVELAAGHNQVRLPRSAPGVRFVVLEGVDAGVVERLVFVR